MALSRSTIICGLTPIVLGAIALTPWLYQQGRTTFLVHVLIWKIEKHKFSRHPEDDIGELVRAIESAGGERRGLAALIPLAKSRDPSIADWAMFAITAFRRITPEALEALVQVHHDESYPADCRNAAAIYLYWLDPAFAKEHGVLPPPPNRPFEDPPVADSPGSP